MITDFATQGPDRATASLRVGLPSHPWLADHGFRDMTVLPGSFYLEAALRLHRGHLQAVPGTIRRARFHHPVLIADRDAPLAVEIARDGGGTVRYAFFETGGNAGAGPCAELEIEAAASGGRNDPGLADPADAPALGGADFYSRLRANGNQYGVRFQGLDRIRVRDGKAGGTISAPAGTGEGYRLHPVLADSALQLLSVFSLDRGGTFVLRGIDEAVLWAEDFSGAVSVRARLRPGGEDGGDSAGDVELLDGAGTRLAAFRGVRFRILERDGTAEPEVVVAATFTAEPVEESLRFWADYLGHPVRIGFAPYGQVFQELLDPGSRFHRNAGGFNVILLNLADWDGPAASAPRSDPNRIAAALGGLARHRLPSGLEVAHLNRHETEYVHREIFEDRCYLRHGIRLPPAAIVVDIGANIGLFSLFVRGQCPDATVLSFEPSPAAFRALKANCEAYGPGLLPFNLGVGEKRGTAPFTVYANSSVFSGFHPEGAEDRRAIRSVVDNMVRGETGAGADADVVDELMNGRLDARTFECPLVTVSDIIGDNGLDRIDLLKIDAEKSELEILRGIEGRLWPRIGQVVVEVHDRTGKVMNEVRRILSDQGFDCATEEETLLAGSGLFNVYATRPEKARSAPPVSGAREKAGGFLQALAAFRPPAGSTTILCVCPRETDTAEGAAAERELLERARAISSVHVIGPETLLRRYPTEHRHDRQARALGHIPYTTEGFAAVGTGLFRAIAGLRRPPYKVIALDCDNTLWRGVCGEDGPEGVEVTPAHRALQEFMVGQLEAGMILCLCSKNNPEDVWAVFDRNPGMVLRRSQLAAARINWAPKSENLRALAGELNLGLDGFILIDDDAAECAEVLARCPRALALQLPDRPEAIPAFLDHVWALDHFGRTEEDGRRTERVREGMERERFRGEAATLKEFIDGLELEVDLFPPAPEDLARAAQLTLRTHQFNFTGHPRSESDLRRFLEGGGRCLTARVRDRFGDYGLVGLLLYRAEAGRCRVDTFLLSCRALGRGVEHRMLADLGRRAAGEGLQRVELPIRRMERNRPAWNFVGTAGGEMRQAGDETIFEFGSEELAGLRYQPAEMSAVAGAAPGYGGTGPTSGGINRTPVAAMPTSGQALSPGKMRAIALDLREVGAITAAIESHRARSSGPGDSAPAGAAPVTLAGRLLALWRRALGNPRVGLDDNFKDAGGTSLKAVQIVAAIRRDLGLPAAVVTLFECPTVRLLAERLEAGGEAPRPVSDAMARGARRKRAMAAKGAP